MTGPLMRIGHGIDVHAFTSGDGFWLAGVWIDADVAVAGHSDGDVALHALADALLGAVGAGDLGSVFGVDRPEYAAARSEVFVREALARVYARQFVVAQVDVTVLAQKPRLGHLREAMRDQVAVFTGTHRDDVSVKFTSTDTLGLIGRVEGLAGFATVGLAAR
ncbi:MAG: 2-C-methyl-D-erythritol 2,4-cyclodiphosphate synthase [Nitriliruptoraceae bacterium]